LKASHPGKVKTGAADTLTAQTADFEKRLKRIEKSSRRKRGRGIPFLIRILVFLISLNAALVLVPPYRYPVKGVVTSVFFFRQKPDVKGRIAIELHDGLDIAAPMLTTVNASAPGFVIEAGYGSGLGNYVRVRHLFGIETVYGHLARIDVAKGRLILLPSLTALGAVGSTGRSTGPHLHFQITIKGEPLPPRLFLVYHDVRKLILGF
jgi:murein DD-endopeptidase MepM/ murein hydrolase activator NlpD